MYYKKIICTSIIKSMVEPVNMPGFEKIAFNFKKRVLLDSK